MQSLLCKYDDTLPDKKEVRRGLPKDREFECTRRQMPQVQAQVIKELLSAMVTVLPIMGQWRKRLCDLEALVLREQRRLRSGRAANQHGHGPPQEAASSQNHRMPITSFSSEKA